MNRHIFRILFFIVLLVVVIGGAILTSCAVPTDTNGQPIQPNTTPQPVGKEMILVGQYRDVQVYKMIDNITEVICYVTISTKEYMTSSIFCLK